MLTTPLLLLFIFDVVLLWLSNTAFWWHSGHSIPPVIQGVKMQLAMSCSKSIARGFALNQTCSAVNVSLSAGLRFFNVNPKSQICSRRFPKGCASIMAINCCVFSSFQWVFHKKFQSFDVMGDTGLAGKVFFSFFSFFLYGAGRGFCLIAFCLE